MQLIPCEGNQASCEILCTLTGTCSLGAICTDYFVWILESFFSSTVKAEGQINPFHMLLLFLCAYLYYDSISEALPAALSALWVYTAKIAKDCMLTVSEIGR